MRPLLALGILVVLGLTWLAIHLAMPSWYARAWYPLDHAETIKREAATSGIEPALIAAVIYRESGFSASARSDRGAVGLMQVLPDTAEWISSQPGAPPAHPARIGEPEVNIAYGTWYLHYLIDKYGAERVALAAYNGGETNVVEWERAARAQGRTLGLGDIPFPETQGFVRAVEDARGIYRRAWRSELTLR